MDSKHLVIATTILLAGCAGEGQPEGTGEVEIHVVNELRLERQESFAIPREFAGLVLPKQSTDIGFERGGELVTVNFDEGDAVAPGAVLARLDTELLETEANELAAQLDELTARGKLNAAKLTRALELQEKGFAADQQIDELTAERDTIAANRLRVDAALAASRERMDQSLLIAPFGGTISRRFADDGTVVSAGAPVLRIIESSALEVRVGVPVRLGRSFEVGDAVRVRAAGKRFDGRVLAIGNDVTRATLTLPLRLAVAIDAAAVAGDQAWLSFEEEVAEPGYWVPITALTDGLRGLWNVYALATDDAGGLATLEARDVRILFADEQRAYVAGALRDGERIVANGLPRLVPGQRVRVATPVDSQPTEAAGP